MADRKKKSETTSTETSKETMSSSSPPTTITSKDLFGKNLQATITYCSVFWSFGMCVALLGPTLLDLGCQTSSKLDSMAWVFLAQTLSTLVGSMLGGILVDRGHKSPQFARVSWKSERPPTLMQARRISWANTVTSPPKFMIFACIYQCNQLSAGFQCGWVQ
ncbi:sodium-dependent glucose transporter 1-like [Anneissia japonica]|uniref:sodium-dependent glucose transporter 1-like n=1 Tax=Anneissia japonica TaxID=1529436 RepID=UPI001425B20F|nr:sodium-dependent glucose transporter 1-like [Anneissia japonica]